MSSLYASTQYPDDLQPYVDSRAVESRDLRAVSSLLRLAGASRNVDPLSWVAFALVLGTSRSGHTCVDFSHIDLWLPEDPNGAAVRWPADAAEWVTAVLASTGLVCSPAERDDAPRRPFVLDGTRLYAARSYEEELRVAGYLRNASAAGRLSIITGGPGSGKTTEVARRIVAHMSAAPGADTVALAAPTGLAAKRMDRALRSAVRWAVSQGSVPSAMESVVNGLPKFTVHKLLKYNPVARVQWRFNAKDRMPYDLVVIDEVSMMPLSMMARVLEAMKEEAQLVLVGDPHQLASVDAGTVLADIVEASARGAVKVEPLTGKHRFEEGSPVDDIATHTKAGDADAALAAVRRHAGGTAGEAQFAWVDPVADDAALQQLARAVADHARELCALAAGATTEEKYRQVLEFRDSLQVVCAHRRGNLGVSGWNSAVERQLGDLARGQWYVGRPVMVTRNDSFSGLSNGDIGVVCRDANDRPVVVFGDPEGVTVLPIARVPHVETVHALTIHKSQGSEFGHTVVVLPKGRSRILTRELLYTGMTRAKPHLTIVATEEALRTAIGTKVQRATGLAGLL
ncbi:MAG: exodeoxyribonuclease V subunit alpha [Actinomycetota bacterium]